MKDNYVLLNEEQMKKYLVRMGLPEYGETLPEPTKELLDRMVLAHQRNVPFENWDPFTGKLPISLDVQNLYDKVVVRKHGGYCFELNGLFISLLKGLGYNAWSCFCRVIRGGDVLGPISHRGSIIEIEGKRYFTDVGFGGPMPGGALCLEDGLHQTIDGEDFWPVSEGRGWWSLMRTSKGKNDNYDEHGEKKAQREVMFMDSFTDPLDFLSPNAMVSENEQAPFQRFMMVNLKTETGYKAINGIKGQEPFIYKEKDGDNITVRELKDINEVFGVLKEKFGFGEEG